MAQSVERTLDILETLASNKEDISLSHLCETLNLSISTTHRLLHTLIARGYAAQDKDTRRYGPGPKLLEIAASATNNSRFNLRRIAKAWLQHLTASTGETSNLVEPRGNEIIYIDQVISPRLVRMFTEVGRRSPLYCTSAGKAILAAWTPQQFDAYLLSAELPSWTSHTITSPERLRLEIKQTQQRGFAIDDEEREEGVRCVAAPIFDHAGRCVAALSISGPATRMTMERVHELGPHVRQAALECSMQLGYHLEHAAPNVR
jgi:IclR family acetate operon transcriptional repressor